VLPQQQPSVKTTPKKEKTPKDDESEYYYDEDNEEQERLKRLRLNKARAHRGFSQAEIAMMRWEPAPKQYPPGETEYEWGCGLCKRLISGVYGSQP
jgi:membrane protein involved in colicin uptake